jgi:N-dimethylarginine dimethylaminohydrolase
VVVNTGCEQLMADLRAWGYAPRSVELDEFLKAGGSAKCLTIRLDGEEAAVWG